MEPEESLSRVLLAQACEESDPEARFVTRRAREAATRESRQAVDGREANAAEKLLAARAARLSETLEHEHPTLRAARSLSRLRIPAWPVLAATTAFGLAVDTLGGERRINLLAFPLLGLLVWNAAVYLVLLLGPLMMHRKDGVATARLAQLVGALVRRVPASLAPEESRWLAASLRRFSALWTRRAGALLAARVERALHVGALGFALGVVGGMYLRGLAFEYRASWESTFLGTPQVATLLSAVLGPAARVLDAIDPGAQAVDLLREPSVAQLRAEGGTGGGPAAPWVHLWALTAAGWIGVPRALLALRAGGRAQRLARELAPDLEDPYALRVLAPARGAGTRVEVIPYSHRLGPDSAESLRELLVELFGVQARVSMREPLAYGADPPALEALPASDPHCRIVIFNLAQPPESEVHGAFLDALRAQGAERPRPPALLVLLDEGPYRERLGGEGGDGERLGQRRRAWERVARPADLRVALLRALPGGRDEALAEARAALGAPGEAA